MHKRNIKLTIAYDGFDYCGWQTQPNKPTIQGTIESAIERLTNQKIQITGASRTDSGVSALGQTANFIIDSPIPTANFKNALNNILPDEIAIIDTQEVLDDFNSRFDAESKEYQYTIYTGKNKPVMNCRHCWFYPYNLDVEAMSEAAKLLIGTKDFKAFASAGDERDNTIRTVFDCHLNCIDQTITFTICGNGFLYNMVRNIVGTLTEIGKGKWQPNYINDIIQSKDRSKAGILAPAQGLCLMSIKYSCLDKE